MEILHTYEIKKYEKNPELCFWQSAGSLHTLSPKVHNHDTRRVFTMQALLRTSYCEGQVDLCFSYILKF